MPFIGYLILFNPSFVDFFSTKLPGSSEGAHPFVLHLHSLKLVFLYFGLLSLGSGILLYIGFAPEQIRKFPSVSSYIAEMEQVSSMALLTSRFDSVVTRFLRINAGERSHPMFGHQRASFPAAPSGFLHLLISGLFSDLDADEVPSDVSSGETEGTMLIGSPYHFYTGSGHLRTDQIMEVMYSGRLVDRVFLSNMHARLPTRSKEFFFLEHLSLDYSAFFLRIVVAVLFGIAFILLLIPTLTTSALVFFAAMK